MNDNNFGSNTFSEEELLAKINKLLETAEQEESLKTEEPAPVREEKKNSEKTKSKAENMLSYYFNREDYDKIIDIFNQEPSEAINALYRIKVHHKKNEYDDSFKLISSVESQFESLKNLLSEFFSEKGRSYLANNLISEAKGFFSESLHLNEANVTAKLGLASLSLIEYNYGDCLKLYDEILSTKPDNSFALIGKANVFQSIGKIDEAVQFYNKVIEIDEENIDAMNGLLRCSYINKDFSHIEKALGKYLDLHQADVNMQFVAASVYFEQKKFDQALKCLDTIVIFDENYPGVNDLRRKIESTRGF